MRVLIVEDEIIIADTINDILIEKGYQTLEPSVSYSEAIQSIENSNPSLVLLDIQLKGKRSGIDLGRELNSRGIPFIYLTSNSDEMTMQSAIETYPQAFLTKPIVQDHLIAAIEIARIKIEQRIEENAEKSVFINDGKKHIKIMLSEILFLKSENVYVEIHIAGNERIVTRSSLKKIHELLDENFIQVHRSYIVNINKIDVRESNQLKIGQFDIPIGDKYKKELTDSFK